MKKMLLLGVALSGLFCMTGQTARAGDDGPAYAEERPAPRYYEGRVVERRCYLPPPPPIYYAPAPAVVFYGGGPRYYHHRRHYNPYAYGYGYGRPYCYAPGVQIGIGF